MEKLQATVLQTLEQITRETGTIVNGEDMLDQTWCQRVKRTPNIKAVVDELQDILEQACRSSLTRKGRDGKTLRHKPIPWWTSQLTTQRKEVNAKRRRYQRTKKNNELREQRKGQYLASKAEYVAAIRREEIKSWKEFCNLTSVTNPWNAIYKMAAGKTERATHITTLTLQDGSLTTNLQDTLLHMIQKFAPDDNQEDDTDTHSQIRTLT